MGFPEIEVYDDDTVDIVNLGSQLYKVEDIGRSKVEALKENILAFTDTEITVHNERTDGSNVDTDVLILAVDSIDVRAEIVKNAQFNHLVDGRMGGQTFTVFYYPELLKDQYLTDEIFPAEEASELPCSEKAICYNTFGCASFIAATLKEINNGSVPAKQKSFCYLNQLFDQDAHQ